MKPLSVMARVTPAIYPAFVVTAGLVPAIRPVFPVMAGLVPAIRPRDETAEHARHRHRADGRLKAGHDGDLWVSDGPKATHPAPCGTHQ